MSKTHTSNCKRQTSLLLCSWLVRLGFCQMPNASIAKTGFHQKPQKTVVVSRILSTQPAGVISSGREESRNGLRWENTTGKRKSVAATWLQWTLGGLKIGLTTLAICARRLGGNRLVIQKSEVVPEFDVDPNLTKQTLDNQLAEMAKIISANWLSRVCFVRLGSTSNSGTTSAGAASVSGISISM